MMGHYKYVRHNQCVKYCSTVLTLNEAELLPLNPTVCVHVSHLGGLELRPEMARTKRSWMSSASLKCSILCCVENMKCRQVNHSNQFRFLRKQFYIHLVSAQNFSPLTAKYPRTFCQFDT